jgi:hypothetical protein
MRKRKKTMNLETYLETNNREIDDVVLLFSVGAALDKISGDTFPMLIGGKIGFESPMNLMNMDISSTSKEWYNSLAFGDKGIVDETMDELSYQRTMVILGVAQKETDRRLTDLMEESKCLTPPNIGSKCLTPPNIGGDR